LLGHIPTGTATVVADLEAGIGTLTRLDDNTVDVALVVVDATPKSLEVGRRAVEVARDKGVGRIVVVANRVRSPDDRSAIAAAFPGAELAEVPEDAAIVDADRQGTAPLDHHPRAPAVEALAALAGRLTTV
jgi:CO dehydrogenase maturation factor